MFRINPKNWQQNRLGYISQAAQILLDGLDDATAVGYVRSYDNGRAGYMVFYAKQSRPAVHYSAKNAEAARVAVLGYLTTARDRAARAAAEKAAQKAQPKKAYHESEGRDGIECRSYNTAQTAVLIREALKAAFPETKFSVRSETYAGGSSVHIEYTDGPAYRAVDTICQQYRMGDFNSMDDSYEYRSDRTRVDESGPYRVSYGAKYVSTSRNYSAAYGFHCQALDLRTPPALGAQIQCWYRTAGRQYSFDHVGLQWDEKTGNVLLSADHQRQDLLRFNACLRAQGADTETEAEEGKLFLAVYGARFVWQEELASY